MSFTSLGLSEPILKAIKEKGYDSPSPIQAQAIPAVLKGHDVMAAAQTGTGKTAGFTLPLLEQLATEEPAKSNQAKVLILTPTRELAAQIADSVETYGKHLSLRSTVVFGGVKINPQMMKLRKGTEILVATPGRLLDLYNQNAIHFKQLSTLVLDEADRMLDMGFIHDIRKILALLPKQRQTLMFSATFSDDIRKLAKGLVKNPVEISVTPPNSTVESVEQWVYPVDKAKKSSLLTQLIKDNNWFQVLVFTRTKHGANRLAQHLEKRGIRALAIHGNKSQNMRTKALANFKNKDIQVLVATDIAARGLDISQLPHVVNFDLPHVAEDYVHRIGRTGRASATGQAISLVCADEFKELAGIERFTKQIIERQIIEGFEPVHTLPPSRLDKRPIKAKKPKKPNAGHKNKLAQKNKQDKDPQKSNKPKKKPNQSKSSGSTSQKNDGGQTKKQSSAKTKSAKKTGWRNKSKHQSGNTWRK